jgi:hypothetical protein
MANKKFDFMGNRLVSPEEAKEFDKQNMQRNIDKTEALIKAGLYPKDQIAEWRKNHPEPIEKKEPQKFGQQGDKDRK